MTELDRVARSDNFNFRGFPSFLQVCKKQKKKKKKKKKMECLHGDGSAINLNSKILGVRLPVYPVMINKVLMLVKSFDACQRLSSINPMGVCAIVLF